MPMNLIIIMSKFLENAIYKWNYFCASRRFKNSYHEFSMMTQLFSESLYELKLNWEEMTEIRELNIKIVKYTRIRA